MPLEIQIEKRLGTASAGPVTIKLTGSLDTATAPELERQLAPVLAGAVKELVFDLALLKFISSAGLRVFSTARKQVRERGGQASFVNMQPQIQEVFEIIKALPASPCSTAWPSWMPTWPPASGPTGKAHDGPAPAAQFRVFNGLVPS